MASQVAKPRSLPSRLAWPIGLVTLVVMAAALGPDLVAAWWLSLTSGTRRALAVGFLNAVLIGYGTLLVVSLLAGSFAMIRLVMLRRRGRRSPWAPYILLLSVTTLVSLGIAETAAWGWNAWRSRLPQVAESPLAGGSVKVDDHPRSDDPGRDLVLLVLGESSAQGQPYEAWTSIGHMVAWQLEQAQPGRRVRLIMAATGGANLTEIVEVMEKQTERPDLVLLYAGHNEFQARWGWTRVVDYYPDDVREQIRARLIERVGNWTPICRMVRDSFETQMIDYDPPPQEKREMVDRPVCEPETRAAIRDLFEAQLEIVARWCESRSAVPIFVVPAGNDVGFDPDRSVLDPRTSAADRARFAADFREVRDLEATDPRAAMTGYRALIARQEGFAETHYRLAILLQHEGRIDEARREYARARDLDGLPMRCPGEFQNAYRRVASRHDIVLIEAPDVLQQLSPTGLLDDNVFHDGQHTTFLGYVALAQEVLDQLAGRGVFGLSGDEAPSIDPETCAAHFGLGAEQWAIVCERSALIWDRLARLRYETGPRRSRADLYEKAARRLRSGEPIDAVHVPGLGVHPAGF